MTEKLFKILESDNRHYILYTNDYIFHLNEKTHVEKIGKLIVENEQLKSTNMEYEDACGRLEEENEQLKTELRGMEELLKSYRKTIEHNAELLADATKNGYLPLINERI